MCQPMVDLPGVDEIREANRELLNARARLSEVVWNARQRGATWDEIGEVLGTTKQAAYKRFGKTWRTSGATMSKTKVEDVLTFTESAYTHIAQGQPLRVTEAMTPEAAQELRPEDLTRVWDQVVAELGGFLGCTDTMAQATDGTHFSEDEEVLGTVIGVTTLCFEAGQMMGRVAINHDGKIAGILIIDPSATSYPF